jgi:hypothetical protein
MKNMVNASESNYGVIEDYLIMDSEPVLGTWTITAKVQDRVKQCCNFDQKFLMLLTVILKIFRFQLTFLFFILIYFSMGT